MNVSLKTKFFALMFFSLALATIPAALISAVSLRQTVLDTERRAFAGLAALLEEQIQQRYMNLQRAKALDVARLKESMQEGARLVARLWPLHATAATGEGVRRVMRPVLEQVRENGATFDVYGKNGGLRISTPLWTILAADMERRDFKGDSLRSMLEVSSLPPEGVFAVFDLKAEELRAAGYAVDEEISSVLTLFRPRDNEVICLAAPVKGWRHWKTCREETLRRELQYKLSLLGGEKRVAIGVLSEQGRVLAGTRKGLRLDPRCLPPDVFRAARRNTAAEFVEGGHDARTVHTPGSPGVLYRVTFLHSLNWFLVTAVEIATLEATGEGLVHRLGLTGLAAGMFSLLGAWLLAAQFTRPLRALTRKAQELAATDFSLPVTPAAVFPGATPRAPTRRGDEVARLTGAFAHMENALRDNIGRLMELTAAKERMQGELDAARQIQRGILPGPGEMEARADYALAALLEPAKEVGGDFYDVLPLPDGRLALAIGDVSGKGVPAALFMAMTVTLVRSALLRGLSPEAVLDYANDTLCARNPENMFVTLWVGILDPRDGRLDYANAGHCLPLTTSGPGDGPREIDALGGPVAGMLPGEKYTAASLRLRPGETCLLYSDGVTEAMDPSGRLFGGERLRRCMENAASLRLENLPGHVLAQVRAFRGHAEQSDDITMLCFRWNGPRA